MGWYRDKARDNIDAKLVLAGAGATGKALQQLAKIPLNMGRGEVENQKLSLKAQELDTKRYIAQLNNNTKMTVAQKNAAVKKYVADRGYDGRAVTAAAKDRATNVSAENNKRTTKTQKEVENIRQKTAKIKKKPVPKLMVRKVVVKDGDKTVTTSNIPINIDDYDIDIDDYDIDI